MNDNLWESRCWCGVYDEALGQTVWCYLHKGPHPLIRTEKEVRRWEKMVSKLSQFYSRSKSCSKTSTLRRQNASMPL